MMIGADSEPRMSMLRNLPVAQPGPDARRFIDGLMGRRPSVPTPLVEYLIDDAVLKPIVEALLGLRWAPWPGREPGAGPADRKAQKAFLDNYIQVWLRLGYDCVRFESGLPFPERTITAPDTAALGIRPRAWADEHAGAITSWEDYERYPWPRVEDFDFFPFEYLAGRLPEGMGLLACHAGGPFEHLSWIMSLEGLCLALKDNPDLVRAVADRIGLLLTAFYAHILDLDRVSAVFAGDDLGFRTGTLIAPGDLRTYVLPWHKLFVSMAHRKGLPYFLHSCGNLSAILDDLIGDIGIDGKHSFEDAIEPAEAFQERLGGRVAVLGGVDLNILAAGRPEDVRRRTRALVETCGARGRFAVGSGNSIPSYVPVENFLAMVDEALGCGRE
jgi:uroporphyrinogen decarboxylase